MQFKKSIIILLFFFICTAIWIYPQSQEEIDKLIDRGIIFERENNLEGAIETYRKVLSIDASNILVKIRLAKVLSWTNRFDEALILLNEVLEIEPEQSEALFRKAQIVSWQGKYDEAIELYNRYLLKKKNDPDALMGLARVHFWSGKNEDAAALFNDAILAGADEIDARLNLGKVYLAMEEKEMAIEEFNRVLAIDPENEEAKRYLEGIPTLLTYEIAPFGLTWNIYPDKRLGIIISSFLTYHHRQTLDVTLQFEFATLNATNDHSFSFTSVYYGISNLYLLGGFKITPDADFSPSYGAELGVNYSFHGGFGMGIGFSSDVYQDAPLGSIQDDTLYAIKPEIVKYFGDVTYILFGYNRYFYSSGYSTGTFRAAATLDYYKRNALYAGLTYGGSVEIKDKDRRVFEVAVGISHDVTQYLELSLAYSYLDTQYGQTHQISFQPIIKW